MTTSKSKKQNLVNGASPMNWDDMKKVVRGLTKDRNYTFAAFILLGCTTGYRQSDLVKLTWKDVLSNEGFITLQEEKTGKTRTTKVAKEIQAILQGIYHGIGETNLDTIIMSGNRSNGAMSRQYINRQLKYIKSNYLGGFKGQFSTHTLRKTFGKRMYDMAEDKQHALVLLSKMFNHSSVAVTREYIGLQAQEIEDIFDSIW